MFSLILQVVGNFLKNGFNNFNQIQFVIFSHSVEQKGKEWDIRIAGDKDEDNKEEKEEETLR